jgi:hypothetical protein
LQVTYPVPFQGGTEQVTCIMFWTASSVRFWTLSGHHTLASLSLTSLTDDQIISSWEVCCEVLLLNDLVHNPMRFCFSLFALCLLCVRVPVRNNNSAGAYYPNRSC